MVRERTRDTVPSGIRDVFEDFFDGQRQVTIIINGGADDLIFERQHIHRV